MKRMNLNFLCLVIFCLACAKPSAAFADLDSNHWAYSQITSLAQGGFVTGDENNNFSPYQSVSVAHFSTMLSNAFYGRTLAQEKGTDFEQWWEPYVKATYKRSGYNNTEIGEHYAATSSWGDYPTANLSRYDMAAMICALLEDRNLPALTEEQIINACDSIVDDIYWSYRKVVATAYHYGFLSGNPDGTFGGNQTVNRAQSAVVLSALLDSNLVIQENVSNYPVVEQKPSTDSDLNFEVEVDTNSLHTYVTQMFVLVNQVRAEYGLPALVLDLKLCALAQYKSDEMSELNYLDHTSPTYGSFENLLALNTIYASSARENLARGQYTPQEAMDELMASTNHRNNILSAESGKIGIGFTEDGFYWAQHFTDPSATTGDLNYDGDLDGSGTINPYEDYYGLLIPFFSYDNYYKLGYLYSEKTIQIPIENTGNVPLTLGNIALSGGDANAFVLTSAPSLIPVGGTDYIQLKVVAGLPVGSYSTTVTISHEKLSTQSQYIYIMVAEDTAPPADYVPPAEQEPFPEDATAPEETLTQNDYRVVLQGTSSSSFVVESVENSAWYYQNYQETRVVVSFTSPIPEGVELAEIPVITSYFGATVTEAKLDLNRTQLYITFQGLPYSGNYVLLQIAFQSGYRAVLKPTPISLAVLINGEEVSSTIASPYPLNIGDTLEVVLPAIYEDKYQIQISNESGTVLMPNNAASGDYGDRSSGIFTVVSNDFYIGVAELS